MSRSMASSPSVTPSAAASPSTSPSAAAACSLQGQPCAANGDCCQTGGTLECGTGNVCAVPPAPPTCSYAGESCFSLPCCYSGLECLSNTCTQCDNIGATCNTIGDCCSGLECDANGECAIPIPCHNSTQSCNSDDECCQFPDALVCMLLTSTCGSCLQTNGICSYNSDCCSQICYGGSNECA